MTDALLLIAAIGIITGLVVLAVRASWLDKLSAGALWGALTGAAYLAWAWLTGRGDVEPPAADEPPNTRIDPAPHPKRSTTHEDAVADDLDTQRDGDLGERLRRFRERAAEDRRNGLLDDD